MSKQKEIVQYILYVFYIFPFFRLNTTSYARKYTHHPKHRSPTNIIEKESRIMTKDIRNMGNINFSYKMICQSICTNICIHVACVVYTVNVQYVQDASYLLCYHSSHIQRECTNQWIDPCWVLALQEPET